MLKYPKVKHLYKYYPYNKKSLSMLRKSKIWYSKPYKFNDPFDCGIELDSDVNSRDLQNYLKIDKIITDEELEEMKENAQTLGYTVEDMHKAVWADVLKRNYERVRDMGICSLSESSDNILMWAHYADHHKGFCVEFLRTAEKELGNYEITRRVKYRVKYPRISIISPRIFDLLFFTKAKDWEYEREWRLVNDKGNIEEHLPGDISAIIFGLRMPDQHKRTIQNIMSKQTNIKYCEAAKSPNQYRLKIRDL